MLKTAWSLKAFNAKVKYEDLSNKNTDVMDNENITIKNVTQRIEILCCTSNKKLIYS